VAKAVEQAVGFGVDMMTLHAAGGVSMMQAARDAAEKQAGLRGIARPQLLAVTVLTSTTPEDLAAEGYHGSLQELVTTRARLAQLAGIDGVVCSPQETKIIKECCGSAFLAVTPGIRPADRGDDQRRVATPQMALRDGSDYLVIGRPITAAADPVEAAEAIVAGMN
jgi:orotidine-5'-phosphate decarboxylase